MSVDDVDVKNVQAELPDRPPVENQSEISLTRKVVLPSKGYLYGEQLPGGEVTVNAMTIKEEKLLADPAADRNEIINKLLDACVEGLPFDLGDLLVGDKIFLLFMIRSVSYGPDYSFELQCPACSSFYQHNVNIPEDLGLRVLTEEDEEPFYADLPLSKTRVGLRLMRVKDERQIEKQLNKKSMSGQPLDEYIYRLAKFIVSIDGEEVDVLKAMNFVSGLYSRDSIIISDTIEDMDCGPDFLIDVICPRCGNKNKERLPLTVEFFRPKSTKTRRPEW